MNFKSEISPSGFFKIEKFKADGSKNYETEFKNTVLNVGWDHLLNRVLSSINGSSDIEPRYLYLGTGTSEPTPSDLGLQNVSTTVPGKIRTGGPSFSASRFDEENQKRISSVTMEFNYGEGEAEGIWTEIGTAFDSNYVEPFNRSLIKDENGNPRSITILSDESLRVTVTLEIAVTSEVFHGSTTFNGEPLNYTFKTEEGLNATTRNTNFSSSSHRNFWHGFPRSISGGVSGINRETFFTQNGDLRSEYTVSMGPGSNASIQTISIGTGSDSRARHYSITFEYPIVKDETERLDFSFSWEMKRGE